ncbi:pilus assembly protein [Hydrogenophaga sp.]|uniref:pilus assembly protein n=1 Tax=Hydrogenophaga sp. TaxID=1904254 RepID=UPI002730396E|nr:PilC/PilY family type IV pilus protein [Hydrogenophaga sp.]MDP2073163.1 PilC/PilY family type IV pilus protein [Hydrogenophaga sp.]MDP3109102.1 PilC/PilY family type IV pilus protein [Hydrogenophaga sp.]
MANIARKHVGLALFTALAVVGSIAFNQTTTNTPLVSLPDVPLYASGSRSKANLTLALSVETPTVGAAYTTTTQGEAGAFAPHRTYIGYFDPMVCYVNVMMTAPSTDEYFTHSSNKATIDAPCAEGVSFDGNFLNWATTSAIDIMRYGLTGGNRVLDEGTGEGRTILERAYLPDGLYRQIFFPMKLLSLDQIPLRTPFSTLSFTSGMYIFNCRDRVYFAKQDDPSGNCASPFAVANAQSPELVKAGSTVTGRFHHVRVQVCDAASATNRPMLQDPHTRRWSGLCLQYPGTNGSGFYKPVGQFQVNADSVRVSVFSYLVGHDQVRYGGVMRAPLKYLGPRHFDSNFNLMNTENPHSEWDPVTGVLNRNPQNGHADYGDQGYAQSGAITYINGFGTLNPGARGEYKDYDPLSELYYEAFRYLQGQQPTELALNGLTGSASSDRHLTENFPAYRVWQDPFAGFNDSPGSSRSCMRNSMLSIADVYTHNDRHLPGNTVARHYDTTRAAETSPVALDVQKWTGIVGSFEANKGLDYIDSTGNPQKASNINTNDPYRLDLLNIATDEFTMTGATGSYLMAGLAYFANTQSFRPDIPKARISTFGIDVNTYNFTGTNDSLRRSTQLYLATKYGGFDDSLTGNTGNPYALGNNLLWQGSNGDAKNFFVVNDPQKFLDTISGVFASLVNETSSIAGGALSSQELRSGTENATFQGGFNPVNNDWSGRVRKLALTLSTDGQSAAVASSPLWDAAEVLTARTQVDHGADRNIVVGSPLGLQGTTGPSPFRWTSALANAHKLALNTSSAGSADTLGEARLGYLRGDRRQERSGAHPERPFRPRTAVLGSVVNSGIVYQGAPASALAGNAYANFQQTHKTRTPVVLTNANDGMLHAFRASDGQELFAYIPGFIVPRLNALTDSNYKHHPLLDATPTVGDAHLNGQWRSVLVSGAGAGAQGIFALDVTEPDSFSEAQVLWEFTDADHTAMGNVLGKPRLVRVRMNDAGSGTDSYKWMAVVPGGVNNHRSDAHTNTSANPSIFFIDLEARPSPAAPWREGVNFWRVELPPGNDATAPGVIQITTVQTHGSGNLEAIVAGDLHGNVWKLSFHQKGVSSLGTDGLVNLAKLNGMGENRNPLFVALSANGTRQPITSAPAIATAFSGMRLIVVGTGKYLETTDNSIPAAPANAVYALLDSANAIADRSNLQAISIDTSGNASSTAFTLGTGGGQKQGWYIDLEGHAGERQVSDLVLDRGRLVFTTLKPGGGSCGESGGRNFEIDVLTGRGTSWESSVGLLGGPMLLGTGNPAVSDSNTSGRRTVTYRMSIVSQGSEGTAIESSHLTITQQVGRMSWRQVHNHRDIAP